MLLKIGIVLALILIYYDVDKVAEAGWFGFSLMNSILQFFIISVAVVVPAVANAGGSKKKINSQIFMK
jgi:hypothetical protein